MKTRQGKRQRVAKDASQSSGSNEADQDGDPDYRIAQKPSTSSSRPKRKRSRKVSPDDMMPALEPLRNRQQAKQNQSTTKKTCQRQKQIESSGSDTEPAEENPELAETDPAENASAEKPMGTPSNHANSQSTTMSDNGEEDMIQIEDQVKELEDQLSKLRKQQLTFVQSQLTTAHHERIQLELKYKESIQANEELLRENERLSSELQKWTSAVVNRVDAAIQTADVWSGTADRVDAETQTDHVGTGTVTDYSTSHNANYNQPTNENAASSSDAEHNALNTSETQRVGDLGEDVMLVWDTTKDSTEEQPVQQRQNTTKRNQIAESSGSDTEPLVQDSPGGSQQNPSDHANNQQKVRHQRSARKKKICQRQNQDSSSDDPEPPQPESPGVLRDVEERPERTQKVRHQRNTRKKRVCQRGEQVDSSDIDHEPPQPELPEVVHEDEEPERTQKVRHQRNTRKKRVCQREEQVDSSDSDHEPPQPELPEVVSEDEGPERTRKVRHQRNTRKKKVCQREEQVDSADSDHKPPQPEFLEVVPEDEEPERTQKVRHQRNTRKKRVCQREEQVESSDSDHEPPQPDFPEVVPEEEEPERTLPQTRKSARIHQRQNRKFVKPTRQDVFNNIAESAGRPRMPIKKKIAAGFTRETQPYNQENDTESDVSTVEEFVTDKLTVEVPEEEVQEEDMVEESQEPNYRQMNLASERQFWEEERHEIERQAAALERRHRTTILESPAASSSSSSSSSSSGDEDLPPMPREAYGIAEDDINEVEDADINRLVMNRINYLDGETAIETDEELEALMLAMDDTKPVDPRDMVIGRRVPADKVDHQVPLIIVSDSDEEPSTLVTTPNRCVQDLPGSMQVRDASDLRPMCRDDMDPVLNEPPTPIVVIGKDVYRFTPEQIQASSNPNRESDQSGAAGYPDHIPMEQETEGGTSAVANVQSHLPRRRLFPIDDETTTCLIKQEENIGDVNLEHLSQSTYISDSLESGDRNLGENGESEDGEALDSMEITPVRRKSFRLKVSEDEEDTDAATEGHSNQGSVDSDQQSDAESDETESLSSRSGSEDDVMRTGSDPENDEDDDGKRCSKRGRLVTPQKKQFLDSMERYKKLRESKKSK